MNFPPLTVAEVAFILDMPKSSVQAMEARALAKLKRILQGRGFELGDLTDKVKPPKTRVRERK